MGIHFVCHHCSYALHVKDFQAGKRGKCPSCKGSFRIPADDSSYSSAVEESSGNSVVANLRNAFEQANKAAVPKLEQSPSDSISITIEPSPISKSIPSDSKKTTATTAITTSTKSSNVKTVKKESKVATVPQEAVSQEAVPQEATDGVPMPAALSEAVAAKWFVRPPSGGQFGPAPAKLLMNWIAESRVTAESHLWREGFADWKLASELVPELFPTANGALTTSQSLTDILTGTPSTFLPTVTDLKPDSATSTRSALVLKKQIQKRRQQLTMIVLLAVVSLILFGILIFVLVFQATKSQQLTAPAPTVQSEDLSR